MKCEAILLFSLSYPPPPWHSILHTVPIQITSSPPGETNIYNETGTQRTFSVDFTGRVEQELQITWEKDGRPLPADYQVTTTYNGFNSPPTGRTSLSFSTIQRKDSGVYRVVFNSTLGAESLPSHLLTDKASFQVNVEGEYLFYDICSFHHAKSLKCIVMWANKIVTNLSCGTFHRANHAYILLIIIWYVGM